MPTNTYQTYLMYSETGTSFTKLVDIISYPDLGAAPEKLDTTTLSNKQMTNILGILAAPDNMEFPYNFEPEIYQKIKALEGKEISLAIWMGGKDTAGTVTPDGHLGKWTFKGNITTYVTGGGVNEVRKATIVASASSEITEDFTGASE